MTLMTDTAFPFAPMGLVHLRNTITQHRPIGVSEALDVSVHAADLRPHPKGSLIDIITTVSVEGAVVWEETMTLFSRHQGGSAETTPAPLDGVEAPDGVVHWKLAGDLGPLPGPQLRPPLPQVGVMHVGARLALTPPPTTDAKR